MKLVAFITSIKVDIDVSKSCTTSVPLDELYKDPEAFEYYLTCTDLTDALKTLSRLPIEASPLDFERQLQNPDFAEKELTSQHIHIIQAVIKSHFDRTNRTESEWNIKHTAKAHLLAEKIAVKLESFYEKIHAKQFCQYGRLSILRPDLANGIPNAIIASLNKDTARPWHWLVSRKGQVIDVKQCFLQMIKGEPLTCIDGKTLLTEEESQWILHHSTFIEQNEFNFKTNPENARRVINAAFTSNSYEAKNIYGAEGVERLSANCMMTVLQPIIQKDNLHKQSKRNEKLNNHDALMALHLICAKQAIEAVTVDDLIRSHAKMQRFFPDMISFEDYARLIIKCLVENYVHRFNNINKVKVPDSMEYPLEYKIARVMRVFFEGQRPLSEFAQHMEAFQLSEKRFISDDDGKLTFPTFKKLYELIWQTKLQPCQQQPSAESNSFSNRVVVVQT